MPAKFLMVEAALTRKTAGCRKVIDFN